MEAAKEDRIIELKKQSAKIRSIVLQVLKDKKGGHLGGAMSIVELLSVLYGEKMNYSPTDTHKEDRDYLVLSKGHAGLALYAALCVRGFFKEKELYTLNQGGTSFPSHPDKTKTPGVDVTTGSLGQGTSIAAGLGYALRKQGTDQWVYLIVGDGELNEGQCWEAFQFIAHHKLNNVLVFIDENKRQLDGRTTDILNPFDLVKKMEAFGFHVQKVPGSDEGAISLAIDKAKSEKCGAECIVLDTVKGQGITYFENMEDNHSVKFGEQDLKETDKALAALEKIYREEGCPCGN